jgi:predicted membrane protein
MGCSVFTISLALALLVLLAGLFLLAYSKKEGLGILTKIASYAAISFGSIVFIGGLVCAMTWLTCHKKQSCKKQKCRKESSIHCKKETSKCANMNTCSKSSEKCSKSSCDKSEVCNKDSKGCCGEKVCSKDEACSKDGKCSKGAKCKE